MEQSPSFPLSHDIPNEVTLAAMREADRIAADPNAERYSTVEEALAALEADTDEAEEV